MQEIYKTTNEIVLNQLVLPSTILNFEHVYSTRKTDFGIYRMTSFFETSLFSILAYRSESLFCTSIKDIRETIFDKKGTQKKIYHRDCKAEE